VGGWVWGLELIEGEQIFSNLFGQCKPKQTLKKLCLVKLGHIDNTPSRRIIFSLNCKRL
jgi:hypothetical protein